MGRVGRGRFRALVVVLAIDLGGATALGVLAAVTAGDGARAPASSPTATALHADSRALAACTAVALLTWLLAVVAVVDAARGRAPHLARRWLWIGLALNTIGALSIAIASAITADREPATGFVSGLALTIGGAAVSLDYLLLLRVRPDPGASDRGRALAKPRIRAPGPGA